jgi:hypothetical protein
LFSPPNFFLFYLTLDLYGFARCCYATWRLFPVFPLLGLPL